MTSMQTCPSSMLAQSALHPSPSTVFPSSHASSPASCESPHVVKHSLGSAMLHVYPHSTVHNDEHPSPSLVSPSSHSSSGVLTPLPQTGLHFDVWHGVVVLLVGSGVVVVVVCGWVVLVAAVLLVTRVVAACDVDDVAAHGMPRKLLHATGNWAFCGGSSPQATIKSSSLPDVEMPPVSTPAIIAW